MDKYQVAANVAINGLDGFTGVLSAKQQKEVFGGVLFGRKTITIDATNQGTVTGRYTAPITRDTVPFDFSFDQIAKARGGLSF
jgi:hypothetical protein